MSRVRKFPLVADNEPVLQMPKTMYLYENEDLITNIQGPYEDKVYNDVTQGYQFLTDTSPQGPAEQERRETQSAGKTYAEMAREEAKRDLKKKRQSFAQTKELSKASTRPAQARLDVKRQAVARPTSSRQSSAQKGAVVTDLSHFAENLHQDSYILAEMPATYVEPQNDPSQRPKKNSYDFLKTSQIYNQKEEQEERERHLAQELNLTRFDDTRS